MGVHERPVQAMPVLPQGPKPDNVLAWKRLRDSGNTGERNLAKEHGGEGAFYVYLRKKKTNFTLT